MIDTNYDETSFFVRHCCFTGGNDPYKQCLSIHRPPARWPSRSSTTLRSDRSPLYERWQIAQFRVRPGVVIAGLPTVLIGDRARTEVGQRFTRRDADALQPGRCSRHRPYTDGSSRHRGRTRMRTARRALRYSAWCGQHRRHRRRSRRTRLADHSPVSRHELVEVRPIPTGEGSADRVGELSETERTRRSELAARPRPEVLATSTDQINANGPPCASHGPHPSTKPGSVSTVRARSRRPARPVGAGGVRGGGSS